MMKPFVTNRYIYGPYGEPLNFSNDAERQGFIGKEKDLESGLADHGVRKYDYISGRFTSVDPLSEKFYGMSPYNYSENNPINFLDDNGKFKIPYKGEVSPFNGLKSPDYNQQYPLFVNLLKNADKYLNDNPTILNNLSKYSGISKSKLLNDFKINSGPTAFLEEMLYFGWQSDPNKFSIRSAEVIKAKDLLKKGNKSDALIYLTSSFLTIIHEYLHTQGLSDSQIERIEKKIWGDFNLKKNTDREDAIKNGDIPAMDGSVINGIEGGKNEKND